jgi:RNAse (barnase) inhibitor barstar
MNKEKSFRSLAYISNQSNEIYNYSNKSNRTYIWLDHNLQLTERRFQSIISPNQWKHFSDAYECQTFILSQQLQNNPKIYLISSYHLAEQLFAYEHVSKIFAAYLYSNQNEIFSKWINNFPVIRGIHKNLDTLFEQIDSDITTNIELLPHHQKQQVSFKEIFKEILFFFI